MLKNQDTKRQSSDHKAGKITYQKAVLQKFGSIVELTTGRVGSIADTSSPGVQPG